MRRIILGLFTLFTGTALFAQVPGYEIKVTLKPFANQYIYLGHYSGKQMPIDDSVKLNANSEAVFKGKKPLGGGIYFIGYPSKDRFFELLIDKQQKFSVVADTAKIDEKKFTNSPDNVLFAQYQASMREKGSTIMQLKQKMETASPADSINMRKSINDIDHQIAEERKDIIKKNPNSILSLMLMLMQEPTVPPAAQHPGGKYDSLYAYRYFKDHYWDGLNFWDDRLARTPAQLFEERVDKYYRTLVYYNPDSVIREIDRMMDFASPSEEMTRFLLVKFVNRYLKMQYMWEDAVFVHLYEKYFANRNYAWLTEQGKKTVTERAYSLMANIMGRPAENINLSDSAGRTKPLYDVEAKYTIVVFWDPLCGHCKETLPRLDSMYKARWEQDSVVIYAVAKEVDGKRKDWTDFIGSHQLYKGWQHVYYSKEEEKGRIDANIPSYSQLYDVQSFPTIFLLDRDKRIIAKKLTWEQISEIIQYRRNESK